MESDEEDFVFYGTPIEREEEINSRKKKSVADASGTMRSLPSWKQEVRDEEGRRRFHGAFTGGFSAGHYNTVGSKEGWTPQSFTSSRKNRAEVKQQNILNFLDEDEKTELEGRGLGTSFQFDTFGFTAVELARKQSEKEQQQRPSAIPGPIPDELVVPAAESIGVKLLLKMGWRHGRAIKDSRANSLYDARRDARKAFLAFSTGDTKSEIHNSESFQVDDGVSPQPAKGDISSSQSTPVYVINPKQDLHGLGFDPFKHAPEFREKKRARAAGKQEGCGKVFSTKNNLFGFRTERVASGFGIGALEELDVEDEDVYTSGYEFEETYVQEDDEPPSKLITDGKQKLIERKVDGVLPGFTVPSNSDYQLERFDPPVIPKDFIPRHKFAGPLNGGYKLADTPPVDVPPPDDNNLKLLIEGVATLVARCGKLFEDLSREKNKSNTLFSFLTGGTGHEYYSRKLWEEQMKRMDQPKHQFNDKYSPSVEKMTAESRGRILHERPLARSSKELNPPAASDGVHVQYNLSDTFTKPTSSGGMSEVVKPFEDDPAKQERFELFLKEKYQGGLRAAAPVIAINMSEAARARERLDFEAAAEAIEKGKGKGLKESKLSAEHFVDFLATGGMRFTSGGVEEVKDTKVEGLAVEKMIPKREEYQWRPAPILCKRFDLIDPYMGKPPPAPRMRSKLDTLIFTSNSVKSTKVEEPLTSTFTPSPQSNAEERNEDASENVNEKEIEVECVDRPVDLYKAIFSDESEDEESTSTLKQAEDPKKKVEVANTTLNRLIAGDFLESLGKELGLEVPPDLPPSKKGQTAAPQTEVVPIGEQNTDILSTENKTYPTPSSTGIPSEHRKTGTKELGLSGRKEDNEINHNSAGSDGKFMETSSSGKNASKVNGGKMYKEDRKPHRRAEIHRECSNSSSSEDEKRRKRSRRRRYKSSDSDDSESSDYHGKEHSRSRNRKKGSSQENKSRRKHSKHHKHRHRDSSPRDHHRSGKDRTASEREKHRWRD
ncbi:G patch domain-containing protein TGH [Cucurbita maxima]|uniref:G patch domain-containing protein TGH n=1 Tax=Cucurbita maxima TaxID=3661 RepID=A0A6J1KGV8_CUCMA|nr:G patch domain-containing protein TGH [Cucurbita maxima]XP_023000787.1 G patch domain-containing protein TGH [Cucurbita maxima]XP_023000794.1 G patch domain-containing protein TGH [Cucurbita maxima]XP_023000803.1 G patch domain-containing protein TGH [Cucurbita maxima]XP_023000811.1 G patch domain-containing protein TGH [Cucurbita maxima]